MCEIHLSDRFQHRALGGTRTPRSGGRGAPSARRGLTLLEVVMATLIVGVMIVVALNALGAVTRESQSFGNRAIALGLAEDLMAEIQQSPYSDPDQDPVFGRETLELASPRTQFDDVDDYRNWDHQPPQARDGTPLADRNDWRRRVTVERVAANDPTQVSAGSTDTGVKRIHVFVEYRDEVLIELVALRADTEQ
jgi:prepilin-type N-terminal cleavage/methylation domain-containing protein